MLSGFLTAKYSFSVLDYFLYLINEITVYLGENDMVLNSITKLKTRKATIFFLILVIPSLIHILPENALAAVVTAVPVGSGPIGVAFDSANGDIYVTNHSSNSVSVINGTTNTVVATIPFGSSAFGVAFDSANEDISVTTHSSNSVSVIQAHSCC